MADEESHSDTKLSATINWSLALAIILFLGAVVLVFLTTLMWLGIFVWVHSKSNDKGSSTADKCIGDGCLQKVLKSSSHIKTQTHRS